jgi:uridine kinase
VSLDDFYRDLAHLPMAQRGKANFDHPDAIDWPLFAKCLKLLRSGEKALLPRYDFASHTRHARPRVWRPRPIVLIDGLWLLRRAELRRIYEIAVFVSAPEALRLARRVDRDQRERGRSRASVLAQWRGHVKPMHDRFVAPQKRLANMVVEPDTADTRLAELAERLKSMTHD